MTELIVIVLEPLSADVSADIRLRQLLKTALRRDRLRCRAVLSGGEAWQGWVRQPGGCCWVRTCCGNAPALVLSILEEAPDTGASFMVLPCGVTPR